MSFVELVLSAAVVLLLVRFGLVAGLEKMAAALRWTPKTRGQVTGLATSAPELVALVAAGLSGVWEAGLWNIASSNIINATLMVLAVARYRQHRDLLHRRFVDELGFAALAVALPIVLMEMGADTQWPLVPGLLGLFLVYKLVDKRVNRATPDDRATDAVGNLRLGLIMTVTALSAIAVAGIFLGAAAEEVVNQMGIHPALAGWLLGFLTSLPEMVTFFAVYGTAEKEGTLDQLEDTQEALDNLAASNMGNVGLVYPLGLAAYLLAT